MGSENNNLLDTSQQSIDKSKGPSLVTIQLSYFASVVVCVLVAFLVETYMPVAGSGIGFAAAVLLLVCLGPVLSLVETAHGIFRAVFLFKWWGTPWPFTILVACLGFLCWSSIFFGCRAVRRPERRMSLFTSHLLFVGYWSGTIYLVHRVVAQIADGLAR